MKIWCKTKILYNNFLHIIDSFNEKIKQNEKKFFWTIGLIYKLVLDLYYMLVISVSWSIDGLTSSPSAINYFASWALYLIGFYMLMTVQSFIISFFLHLQWIITIAPIFVILGAQQERSITYALFILLVLVIQIIMGKNIKKIKPISLSNGKLGTYCCVVLCILVASVWVIMLVWNDFGGIKAFSLTYIYEMRSKLVYPPMFGYFVSWMTKAVIPWLFMMGLYKKDFFMIIYSALFQVLYYMILGHKAPMLMMGIIIAVFFLSKYKVLLSIAYVGAVGGTALGTIGGFVERTSGAKTSIIFNTILGERTLFIPALIKYQFYDFFSVYPKAFFSDGMIGKLLSETNLYKNSLGFTIFSYNNAGSLAAESNTGYLGDSFAQLGFLGMVLIGILVILLIKFISSYQTYIPTEILCCMVGCFVVTLNDAAFFTSFLTGGLWLLLVMLTVYAREGKND